MKEAGRKMLENKDAIIREYSAGVPSTLLGEKYHVSTNTVLTYLRKWGVEERVFPCAHNGNVGSHKEYVIQAYNSGKSLAELAREFGVTGTTLSYHAKKWGIPIRSGDEQRAIGSKQPEVQTRGDDMIDYIDEMVTGDVIRALRLEMRYTQLEIVGALGFNSSTVSMVETNKSGGRQYIPKIHEFLLDAQANNQYGTLDPVYISSSAQPDNGGKTEMHRLIDANREAATQAKEPQYKPVTTRGRTLDMLNEKKGNIGLLAEAKRAVLEFNEELDKVRVEISDLERQEKAIVDGMDNEREFSLMRLIRGKRDDASKLVDIQAQLVIAKAPLPALLKREAVLEERVVKYRALAEHDRMEAANGMVQEIKSMFSDFQQAIQYKIADIMAKLEEKI